LAQKPDSQEICFIPGGDYKRFLEAYLTEQKDSLPDTSGELVTTTGEVIGHHDGIHNFTVGQRKGLGVASPTPLYVLQINGAERKVIVGGNEDLASRTLRANRLNWISIAHLDAPMRVQIKIRHRHEPAWATIAPSSNDGEITATFDEPQRAITPGQAAVFYHEEEVVGGGWIL
ncbi:MAG TPA: aminomethyltransferase beta-barrel domain-containing protein, partial [Acidobacteriaceae bacterium]|nr:aminomethyltransferase beta-barrel domain-containing protein [Acidobacteriaceae bacterium]